MLELADQYRLLIFILLTYSMALSYRVGLLSLAPVAFASLGSYMSALLTVKANWSVGSAVLLTAVAGAAAGALLSVPLRRIKGFYTAIATLALIIIVNSLESSLKITGGASGLGGMPEVDSRAVLLILVLLAIAGFVGLDHTMLGRRLDAAGSSPTLASALGIRVGTYRTVAIAISSAMAALAGAYYSFAFLYVSPTNFDFFFAITIVSLMVIGGVSHWAGPLIGAAGLGLIQIYVRDLVNWAEIIAGGALVIATILEPAGVAALLRRQLRGRRSFRFWTTPAVESHDVA